jgi:hypothetical protein
MERTFFMYGTIKDGTPYSLAVKKLSPAKAMVAIALCAKNSKKRADIFVKRIGRSIAQGRLEKQVNCLEFEGENENLTNLDIRKEIEEMNVSQVCSKFQLERKK